MISFTVVVFILLIFSSSTTTLTSNIDEDSKQVNNDSSSIPIPTGGQGRWFTTLVVMKMGVHPQHHPPNSKHKTSKLSKSTSFILGFVIVVVVIWFWRNPPQHSTNS